MRNPNPKAGTGLPRLLSKAQVKALLNDINDNTLWGWCIDPELKFPLPLEFGPAGKRNATSMWLESEVVDWVMSRPRRKLGQGLHDYRGLRDQDGNPKPPKRGRLRPKKPADEQELTATP